MKHLSSNQPPTLSVRFPPTGLEGRVDVGTRALIPMSAPLNNEKEPTAVFSRSTSPPSVDRTPPFSRRKISANPAPAVPAAFDFCSASPAGPSSLGENQATPSVDRRSRATHIFPVIRPQGVALPFLSSADSPCCTSDASLYSHSPTGGRFHRWPHRSHNRAGHLRLSRRATC